MTVTLRKHLLFVVGKGFLDPEVLLGSLHCAGSFS